MVTLQKILFVIKRTGHFFSQKEALLISEKHDIIFPPRAEARFLEAPETF